MQGIRNNTPCRAAEQNIKNNIEASLAVIDIILLVTVVRSYYSTQKSTQLHGSDDQAGPFSITL